MARHENDFDDDEGFFESLIRRKDAVPMPDSMARLLKIIVGVVVLGVVAVVAWAVWPSKGGQGPDGTVPMIQADSGDFKKAPEEPGGMPIPNKDSALFETMAHKSAGQDAPQSGQVENLLEDSEQPMKKGEVFDSKSAPAPAPSPSSSPSLSPSSSPSSSSVPTLADAAADAAKEAAPSDKELKNPPPVAVTAATSPAAGDDTAKPVEKKSVPEKAPVEKALPEKTASEKQTSVIDTLKAEAGTAVPAKPEKKADKKADKKVEKKDDIKADAKVDKKPVASGKAYIQLAAVKSESEASAKWEKLRNMYPSSLSGLSLHVQKADLGSKGVFYRVQAGPLAADAAATTCAKIKGAGGGCMVVK